MPLIETVVFLKIGTEFGDGLINITKEGAKYPTVQKVCLLARTPKEIIKRKNECFVTSDDILRFRGISESDVQSIEDFLKGLLPPVCLVAHNGSQFHFILLSKLLSENKRAEVLQGMLFADTQNILPSMYSVGGGSNTLTLDYMHSLLVKESAVTSDWEVESKCFKLQELFALAPEKTIKICEQEAWSYEKLEQEWIEYVKQKQEEKRNEAGGIKLEESCSEEENEDSEDS